MDNELSSAIENLDMESYLDYEGIDYRHRHGSRGPQLNIRECPSCHSTDWKVYMNAENGLGNCFKGSCELGTFNKFTFIRAHLENANNRVVAQAITTAAARQGFRFKSKNGETGGSAQQSFQRELRWPIGSVISLPDKNGANLNYLGEREVSDKVTAEFGLRYCHEGFLGSGDFRQDWSGRVLIPVYNLDGELVSYQGRDVTGKAEQKYLFPPGFASTGSYLFNGNNCLGKKLLVIGEGAFDVFAIHRMLLQYSVPDAGALGTFGMHLSDQRNGSDQVAQFIRLRELGARGAVIMWDGEGKAIRRALDAAKRLNSIGLKSKIALLPRNSDPSDLPPSVVKEALDRAADITVAGDLTRILRRIL